MKRRNRRTYRVCLCYDLSTWHADFDEYSIWSFLTTKRPEFDKFEVCQKAIEYQNSFFPYPSVICPSTYTKKFMRGCGDFNNTLRMAGTLVVSFQKHLGQIPLQDFLWGLTSSGFVLQRSSLFLSSCIYPWINLTG